MLYEIQSEVYISLYLLVIIVFVNKLHVNRFESVEFK